MLKVGKKIYRNIQEQVQKNMDDIEDIKKSLPYPSEEYYNKDEVDAKLADYYDKDDVADILLDYYDKNDIDAMMKYLHKITLIWDDGGEEPSYKKAFLEIYSTNSEAYTLETLLQYVGNTTKKFYTSIQYEYGTDYNPTAATITTELGLSNISDSLSVSGWCWTSEDSFAESHEINFTPIEIEDIIE